MENPNDIGVILKTQREKCGLTLEVVQEATKIPIDSLRAIEEGYKIRTLTAFYYKSFVRLYAEHLGLDPLAILGMIPSYQPSRKLLSVERPELVSKPDLRKLTIIAGPLKTFNWKKHLPLAGGILASGLVIVGVVMLVRHLSAAKPAVSQESLINKSKETAKSGKSSKSEKIARAEKLARSEKIEKEVKSETAPVASAVEAKSADAAQNAPEEKAVRRVTLAVRASVTAWLTVKCDGSTVFKGSLKKGSSESWNAAKKIEISGKEVDGLEYEVNGKTIGKLSRRDTKARRVIITPEGLSVEK
ncbi:MAG: DUF4115 domain-containing protein [Candidatus Omnitrophica bacterium]|nr:DUF4115 domain-containing protein [Candidatus Omnitrophota bacterium]